MHILSSPSLKVRTTHVCVWGERGILPTDLNYPLLTKILVRRQPVKGQFLAQSFGAPTATSSLSSAKSLFHHTIPVREEAPLTQILLIGALRHTAEGMGRHRDTEKEKRIFQQATNRAETWNNYPLPRFFSSIDRSRPSDSRPREAAAIGRAG